MSPIVVAEQGPPVSAAVEFLSKVTPTPDSLECESPLLRAIKNVLRGTDSDALNSIHTARFFTGDEAKDYELSWNAQHAVLTYSGVRRTDGRKHVFPKDHGRMKAAYWVECLFTHEIPENEQVILYLTSTGSSIVD